MISFLAVVFTVLYGLLTVYFVVMWLRLLLEFVQNFRRHWRPKGVVLVLAEVVYTVTDPPITFCRRLVPPLRLGPIALDFGWSLVMAAVLICLSITNYLRLTL